MARILEEFAKTFAIFPTVLANAILPLARISVGIDAKPRQRGDFEDRIAEITDRLNLDPPINWVVWRRV